MIARCALKTTKSAQGSASQVFPQAFEEWVPDFPFRGLRPVLDLGQQFWLDPDTLVRDPLQSS
jgi:hypothetical protein